MVISYYDEYSSNLPIELQDIIYLKSRDQEEIRKEIIIFCASPKNRNYE